MAAPPMTRWLTPRSLVAAAAFAVALCGVHATRSPAIAQAARHIPPEPSRLAWVSPDSVAALQGAVQTYQRIAAAGGWPKVQGKTSLQLGDIDPAVDLLRQRLRVTGDLAANTPASSTFDEPLERAVKKYQLRNGIPPTGAVHGITMRSLNVPADARLRQLETNLARMSELSMALGAQPKHIVMNAASFELQGITNGQVDIATRVISGKRTTPTPNVSTNVQAINLLPFWHVPGTIAKAAVIPSIRKDPSYLYKQKIRVFSSFGGTEIDPAIVNWWGPEAERYVFRQDPGPGNALGLLRFDMPNKHIVYMHDTPMKNLFGVFERAYSAGCVRVQNFYGLAEWVLGGQDGWTRQAIEAATATGQGKTIKVKQPVPVHFIYLTAWVEHGIVQFRNDLYNRDEETAVAAESGEARVLVNAVAP